MPTSIRIAVTLLLFSSSASADGYNAKTNYILHCQGCHGADGVGGTPGEVPPLAKSVGWFTRVEGGRAYLAQVPGASQAPISDGELTALLNYMIARFSPREAGPDFTPYDVDEVRAVRRSRPDIVAARKRLVAAVQRELGVTLWADGYAHEKTEP